MQDFICIAHRGASGHWPENTLLAFQQALAAGARWLELDVHLSADGELVVIHDATLERTTDGDGPVVLQTYEQLRSLNAGLGEKIPRLADVLNLAAGRATVNVELKGVGTGEPVAELLRRRFVAGLLKPAAVLASSLNESELRELAGLLPQVPLALVAKTANRHLWRLANELDVWSLHLKKSSINQDLLAEARAVKRKVLAYTVNDQPQLQRLRDWGVDGIFTDYPEHFCHD